MADRVRHVVDCCFKGRRMVIFSGGESKDIKDVLDDGRAIQAGGGYGSIIGRNCFQRPRDEAMNMLKDLAEIYRK
jgi:class I fructose-bisphosphate aldolase